MNRVLFRCGGSILADVADMPHVPRIGDAVRVEGALAESLTIWRVADVRWVLVRRPPSSSDCSLGVVTVELDLQDNAGEVS